MEMDPLVTLLLKNGVFGILAGVGFYLYLKERKVTQDYATIYLEHQVADTAAKTKLTSTLEDLATTIETIENHIQNNLTTCSKHNTDVLNYFQQYIEDQRLKQAREEGRLEITNRFKIPKGNDDVDEPKK